MFFDTTASYIFCNLSLLSVSLLAGYLKMCHPDFMLVGIVPYKKWLADGFWAQYTPTRPPGSGLNFSSSHGAWRCSWHTPTKFSRIRHLAQQKDFRGNPHGPNIFHTSACSKRSHSTRHNDLPQPNEIIPTPCGQTKLCLLQVTPRMGFGSL